MVHCKSEKEIELLRQSNQLVGKTLGLVSDEIRPGIKTKELDKLAYDFIRSHDAVPGFLGYNGYPYSLCISVNSQVVHGMPSDYELKEGDIVSVDCGVLKNGYYGDSAYTFSVGEISADTRKLMLTTYEALMHGIDMAVPGNRIGDIGFAVQNHAEKNGYSVVRELVGHGIGKRLHEPPEVPNYGKRGKGVKMFEGMTIAIEPMINMGAKEILQLNDGWTIVTRDGKPSAHYEHTVVVLKGKAEILSSFDYINEKQIIWQNSHQ